MGKLGDKLDRNDDTPLYNIGTASKLSGLPVYTIRWLEKNGLIAPGRTEGNQRLFSENDIRTLDEIRELLKEHVNVQGIRVVLRIKTIHHIQTISFHDEGQEEL